MNDGYGGGQPEVFVEPEGYANQYGDFLDENINGTKVSNKKGKKDDKSTKDKKQLKPIAPSYEAYVYTVIDPFRPEEIISWVRTRKAQMHLDSQELHDKATAHQKKTGLGSSGQFQKLNTNQQSLVNRLIAEKNNAEKEPNAEWKLFGVRKLYEDRRQMFKTLRVNNAMRVTLRRGDRTKDLVNEAKNPRNLDNEIDRANIVDLREPVITKDAAAKGRNKKGNAKAATAQQNTQDHDNNQNYDQVFNNYQEPQQQQPQYQQHQHQHQQQYQQPQQYQQQAYPQENWSNEQQIPDAFAGFPAMAGALPQSNPPAGAIPVGAIPVPPQHSQNPPEAPMAPQQQHPQDHPFQPFPGVYPQPQPMSHFDERQPRDPIAYGPQHTSARRPSHSRASQSRRRDSMDSDRIRNKDTRKIADVVRDEVRGAMRDEVRDAMRDVVADDKVLNRWPTGGNASSRSSRSTAQDEIWSNSGSSGDRDNRRYSGSTPGTSPERYYPPERPVDNFRRQNSSGARPYVDDRKRYYPDKQRDFDIRPQETYRDRERERGRDTRYPREQRQIHDNYQTSHQRRQQREPQYDMRPRPTRRVTNHPEALRDSNFSRPGRGVDYERTRPNDRNRNRDDQYHRVYDERRDDRNREAQFYY